MPTLSATAPTRLPSPTPSSPLSTSNTLSASKSQMHRMSYKTRAIHHPTSALIPPPIHSDWSSDEHADSTKQKKREMVSKAITIQYRKIVEEESRRKAKERTLSCVPDLLVDKPNLPPTDPHAPAPEKRKRP